MGREAVQVVVLTSVRANDKGPKVFGNLVKGHGCGYGPRQ